MSEKKEKIIPASMLPFTSDSRESLERIVFMCESLMLHYYMGQGTDIAVMKASIVETKDLESFGIPETKEYVKMLKSFGKEYSIQLELVLNKAKKTVVIKKTKETIAVEKEMAKLAEQTAAKIKAHNKNKGDLDDL